MSWKFPPQRIRPRQVTGIDDVNESIWEFVDEVNGHIGEHNFKANAFTSRSRLTQDAGCRTYRATRTVSGSDRTASPANTFTINKVPSWQLVTDLSVNFTGGPAMLWILASFQGAFVPLSSQSSGSASVVTAAIRLDGRILNNGMVGTVDAPSANADGLYGGSGTINTGYHAGPGLTQWWDPCVIEAIVPVEPGAHTVEVVAKPLVMSGTVVSRIYSRELTVLEFRL